MEEFKICTKCKTEKSITEFYRNKYNCKKCVSDYEQKRYQLNIKHAREKGREYYYKNHNGRPASESKKSPRYLGDMAEKALSKFFDNIKRMPSNNPNYDFICEREFKIDVKAACYRTRSGIKTLSWSFNTNGNTKTDYFLLIGFDNRMKLTPTKVFLVPSIVIGKRDTINITNSAPCIEKWSRYERPLDRVIKCCNEMRRTCQT